MSLGRSTPLPVESQQSKIYLRSLTSSIVMPAVTQLLRENYLKSFRLNRTSQIPEAAISPSFLDNDFQFLPLPLDTERAFTSPDLSTMSLLCVGFIKQDLYCLIIIIMREHEDPYEELILGRYKKENLLQKTQEYRKYSMKDQCGGDRVEIKIQMQGHPRPTVLHQAGFLQEMQGYHGFPLMIWSGNHNAKEMGLITSKSGPKLSLLLAKQPNGTFSVPTVCLLGIQLLTILQVLHDKHAILSEVSIDNFCLDPKHVDRLQVSSLLHAKRYRSSKTLQHNRIKEIDHGMLTNHFVSYNRLRNQSLCRRDDIEAMFYLMVFLIKRSLPWSQIEIKKREMMSRQPARKAILEMVAPLYSPENNTNQEQFFKKLPNQFRRLFRLIVQLDYEERPNYPLMRLQLNKALTRMSKDRQFIPDWISWLPSLRKEVLSPSSINLLQNKEKKYQEQFYGAHESRVQLDVINGFHTRGLMPQTHPNGVLYRSRRKRGTCLLM